MLNLLIILLLLQQEHLHILQHIQRETRFFFPFEVQIVDIQSAEENEKGQSAHEGYKRAQVQTALRRVMGNLVNASR